MGNHFYFLDPPTMSKYFICHYIIGASYTNATACIKISLLLQYLRVLHRGTWTYRFTQLMLVFLALWGFAWAFLCWGICLPDPSAYWRGTGKGCYATGSSNVLTVVKSIEAHSAVNVAQDLIVLSIPVRFLFLEDAPIGKKSMTALLSMGALYVHLSLIAYKPAFRAITDGAFSTCVFSIWRLQAIVVTSVGVNGGDLTWNEPSPFLISLAEVYVASLCASIPFFWPIIAQQINKIMVMYEFNVSSEPRYQEEEEIELTNAKSAPSMIGSTKGSTKESTIEVQHYKDDFIGQQVDPFAEGLRVETVAVAQGGSKKKGGFVRFDHQKK